MDRRPDGGGVAANPYRDAAPRAISLAARRVAVALDSAAAASVTMLVAELLSSAVVLQSAVFGPARGAAAGGTRITSAFSKTFQFAGNCGLGARPGKWFAESILAGSAPGSGGCAYSGRG